MGPSAIEGESRRFQNSGGARVLGMEAEVRADFGNDNYIFANYSYQDAKDTMNRNRLPDVPEHKGNIGVNIGFWKYLNANMHTFISGRRPRKNGDTRSDIASYALVNLTLIGKNFMNNLEIRGSALDLFDKSYEDPSPPNSVPTDYPQQGRSFMVELRYKF